MPNSIAIYVYIEEEVGLYRYSATTPSCIHFNDDTKLLNTLLTQEFYRPDRALSNDSVKVAETQKVFSILSHLQKKVYVNFFFVHTTT